MGNTTSEDLEGSGFVTYDLSKKEKDILNKTSDGYGKMVAKLKEKQATQLKLLLLGAGESGKTTVLRQMTLIHGTGFDDNYKKKMKPKICYNVLEGAVAIIESFGNLNYTVEGEDLQKAVDLILETHSPLKNFSLELEPKLADAILLLAKSDGFEDTFRGKAHDLPDGWWIFAERLKKYPAWGGPDWIPDASDILYSRVRTTGINTQSFAVNGANFMLTDVGGQRNERRKWLRLFSGVAGVVYVASLSGYNQVLFEDRTANRLDEAVGLWDKTVNEKEFKDTAMVVFLNKFDLFQKKYYHEKIPIEYKGSFVTELGHTPPKAEDEKDESCENAIEWFTELYLSKCTTKRRKMVYTHVTTALDRNHMKIVMDSCAIHMMQQSLMNSGLSL
mmetsp:Transcript_10415/g.11945  ORF Transcript_10415/g.11945 Transcript_10415/m.11945 type:complete len:389 (+) Transcript_10415:145-1311(+)|eukprot:CAMPEP_0184038636 /NCGR_PEP_ID=MMETSP0955-20130417/48138_1 /TAXON_ID=627963 /ORGANISM="Aplanochytrium sp, Strain PBS07" /LENGTH=388 /DNA_ID=CAMNT_0026327373 /DNA_START=28 /DNA_END=1194 /DNA_ORIENTATION=+